MTVAELRSGVAAAFSSSSLPLFARPHETKAMGETNNARISQGAMTIFFYTEKRARSRDMITVRVWVMDMIWVYG